MRPPLHNYDCHHLVAMLTQNMDILNTIMSPNSGNDGKGGYMTMILQDVPIGRNIQNIRMEKGMTQQAVIEQLQLLGSMMSRSTLANIESGKRNIKASDLRLLKELLKVDYSEFFKD